MARSAFGHVQAIASVLFADFAGLQMQQTFVGPAQHRMASFRSQSNVSRARVSGQYAGIICEGLCLESATPTAWPGANGVRVPRRVPWPAGTRANRIVGAAIS